MFSIDCLEILEGCPSALCKNLKPGKKYFFNNRYHETFSENEDSLIKKAPNFWGDHINVQAIVGKNGSGKSTSMELVYMLINNFSYMFERGNDRPGAEPLFFVADLKASLYFTIAKENDSNQKCYLKCDGKDVILNAGSFEKKFTIDENRSDVQSKNDEQRGLSDPEICSTVQNFFYTIVSNYAMQSLISCNYCRDVYIHRKEEYTGEMGDKSTIQWDEKILPSSWINPIFHKNDGYTRSIVLNPYRSNGVINMDTEFKLSVDRLIALMVKDGEIDDKYSLESFEYENLNAEKEIELSRYYARLAPFKYFGDDLKAKLDKIVASVNQKDVNSYFESFLADLPENLDFLKKITSHWNLQITKESPKQKKLCLLYLYEKICKTVLQYSNYNVFVAYSHYEKNGSYIEDDKYTPLSDENTQKLFNQIENDKSHITLKIRRTLDFLKLDNSKVIELCSTQKFDLKKYLTLFSVSGESELDEIIEHLPPPIFSKKIILKNKETGAPIDYYQLSSGEHQKYQNLSTHLYHILNLISIQKANETSETKRAEYKNINLVFDEIEISFHPEYQRTILKTLLGMLTSRGLNKKCYINIFLLTHSPFILSDIPSSNILFLKEKERENDFPKHSFAGNIGEMIYDSFFLESTIGAFAEEKIKDAVKYRQENDPETDDSPKKKEYEAIVKSIGDPVIRSLIEEVEIVDDNQENGAQEDGAFVEDV